MSNLPTISKEEFFNKFENHQKWLKNLNEGNQLDLSNLDLNSSSEFEMEGLIFEKTKCINTIFPTNLNNVVFLNSDLSKSDFQQCDLHLTSFGSCNLTGANFKDADFNFDTDNYKMFYNCNLTGAHFENSRLLGEFLNSNLTNTVFHDCNLKRSIFKNSKLVGTNFTDSELNFCKFYDCEIITPNCYNHSEELDNAIGEYNKKDKDKDKDTDKDRDFKTSSDPVIFQNVIESQSNTLASGHDFVQELLKIKEELNKNRTSLDQIKETIFENINKKLSESPPPKGQGVKQCPSCQSYSNVRVTECHCSYRFNSSKSNNQRNDPDVRYIRKPIPTPEVVSLLVQDIAVHLKRNERITMSSQDSSNAVSELPKSSFFSINDSTKDFFKKSLANGVKVAIGNKTSDLIKLNIKKVLIKAKIPAKILNNPAIDALITLCAPQLLSSMISHIPKLEKSTTLKTALELSCVSSIAKVSDDGITYILKVIKPMIIPMLKELNSPEMKRDLKKLEKEIG